MSERWDSISYNYYGVANSYEDIMDANFLSNSSRLSLLPPATLELKIPDLPTTLEADLNTEYGKPIWED